MNRSAFYRGVLTELEKLSQSTEVNTAKGIKPQPTDDGLSSGAAQASNLGSIAPHGDSGGLRPASSATSTQPTNTPQPTAQPTSQPPQWHQLSRLGGVAHRAGQVGNFVSPLIGTAIDRTGQALTDKMVKDQGLAKIQKAGPGDALQSGLNPQEQMAAEYGMSRDSIKGDWQKAVADKTYGFGSLDEKGKFQLGGSEGGPQWGKLLNDHWGKILLGLLGVGALGWMGSRDSGGQNITINNIPGGGGVKGAGPSAAPSYF